MTETAWLIECGRPPHYYCGPGDWCSNVNHAKKFATEQEAHAVKARLTTLDVCRLAEHAWT